MTQQSDPKAVGKGCLIIVLAALALHFGGKLLFAAWWRSATGSMHTAKAHISAVPSSPSSAVVTKAELGADWPFLPPVDSVVVSCGSPMVGIILVTVPDGRTYAGNGLALDHGYPQFPTSIWSRDGSTSIAPIQARAPHNCM